MTRRQRIARLERARARVHAGITDAYWTFTRSRRGKPPAMVVPHLYAERRRIDAVLLELRRAGRLQLDGKSLACMRGGAGEAPRKGEAA